MKRYLFVPVFLGAIFGVGPAFGCGTHGTNAGSTLNSWLNETAENHIGQISITDNLLVPPEQRTICVCGIGLGSSDNPLPAGVRVTGVSIVITDANTGQSQVFAPFSFAPSTNMTAGLQRVARETSSAGDRPLITGSRWFGFASSVAPFELPRLRPGQDIAFQYEIHVPKTTLPFTLDVQFAAGEGLADESPDFSGAHPVVFFAAGNRRITLSSPVQTNVAPLRARPVLPQRKPVQIERR